MNSTDNPQKTYEELARACESRGEFAEAAHLYSQESLYGISISKTDSEAATRSYIRSAGLYAKAGRLYEMAGDLKSAIQSYEVAYSEALHAGNDIQITRIERNLERLLKGGEKNEN